MTSLLPIILRDKHNLALEKCIKTALDIDVSRLLLSPIENVEENILPYLAEEAHVLGDEGWDLTTKKEDKQNLIKNTFIQHAKKGTLSNLIDVLNQLETDSEIKEFWEYGGRVGHFSITFLLIKDRSLTEDLQNKIENIVNIYKPATRILDYINFYINSQCEIYISANTQILEIVTISTQEEIIL